MRFPLGRSFRMGLRAARVIVCVLVLVLVIACPPVWAQGCAMCGTAVTSANDPLAKGLAMSILFMLAVPNLLIASIGGWIYHAHRRASRAQSAVAGEALSPENGRDGSGNERDR